MNVQQDGAKKTRGKTAQCQLESFILHSSFCNAKPVKQGEKRESQAISSSPFLLLASIRAKRKSGYQLSVRSLYTVHCTLVQQSPKRQASRIISITNSHSLLAISFYILPLSPLRPRTGKGQGFCRQRACRLWQSGRNLPRCFQGVWSIRGSRAPPMSPHQMPGRWC